ncbi:MAG: zinc metallopeptidase, partial [Clostridia bacterium]|nr:zinc metallopeptidase [Clostridia bacterium]
MYYYLLFMLILLPFLAFSGWASAKVNTTYSAFDKVPNRSNMTGYDAAVRLLRNRGVHDISVNRINGRLTDHYHPTKKEVNLSMSTYGSASVAGVAVAAHEIGHVMQKKEGYVPYKIRNVLVPLTNIGSRLALPVMILGILIDIFWMTAPRPYGEWLVYLGIALYGLSSLFMLVTLPVELNASKRAKKMLVADGILSPDEVPGASKVLTAAALTYVASLCISLVY